MKRIFNIATLVLVFGAIVLFWFSFSTTWFKTKAAAPVFANFGVGQTRLVNFEARKESLEEMTDRERFDQMRDWLLLTVVSTSGLPIEEINQATFDVPSVRHKYLQSVSSFEYGETRSCLISDGRVVAVVPPASPAERSDALARIADQQRKNLGEMPDEILVFEYRLETGNQVDHFGGSLTRRENVKFADIFTPAYGYFESKITSQDELNKFMSQIDDVTFAKIDGDLILGGRKMQSRQYRGIRVEDIAAIWQSEKKISNEGNLTKGSGFSLDPTFDYPALVKYFDKTIEPFARYTLNGNSSYPNLPQIYRNPNGSYSTETTEDLIKNARADLDEKSPAGLYKLCIKLSEKRPLLGEALTQDINQKFGFQSARYDGYLQGTEVGMVLFYTDLMAKLWALDFHNSAPKEQIKDFLSLPKIPVSTIHKKEMSELTNTRLWFGVQTKGFQLADEGKSILFGQTATRVYAASSNPLKPGVESQASADSARFLGWWDDHYEEVARFEPEYERLNEIMKWSLLISWLNKEKQGDNLDFLKNVSVDRSNFFPDWAAKHKELRFQDWGLIGFFDKGAKDSKTEALPLLSSESYKLFGEILHVSGGVSLADRKLMETSTALSKEINVNPLLKRSQLNYGTSKTAGELVNIEGTRFNIKTVSPREAVTTSSAKETLKLRGDFGEVSNRPFERLVTKDGADLNLAAKVDNVEIGTLKINNTSNGFQVGWDGRNLDLGQSLARRVSQSKNPAEVVMTDANVEAAIRFEDGKSFLVKFRDSDRYLHLTPETSANSQIQSGWQSRVGNTTENAVNYNLNWKQPGEVNSIFSSNNALADKSLILRPIEKSARKFETQLAKTTKDAAAQTFEIESGNTVIKGTRNAQNGEINFVFKELPEAIRQNPAKLNEIVGKVNFSAEQNRYLVSEFAETGGWQSLKKGNFKDLASDLMSSPADFKVKMEELFSKSLIECDQVLKTGQTDKAIKQLDAMIDVYGKRSELLLRKGVAELSGKFPKQSETFEAMLAGKNKDSGAFFDELSLRLHQENVLPENVRIYSENGDAAVVLKSKISIEGAPSKIGEIENGYVFVQDTPSLNNLDWSAPINETINTAVSGNYARVFRFPSGEISDFNPTRIYTAEGGGFRSVVEEGAGYGFRTPRVYGYSNFINQPCPPANENNRPQSCQPDSEKKQEKWVYLIVANKE